MKSFLYELLLILKVLSRQQKLHGYAIMTAIKQTSGDVLNAEVGLLYPALRRMEEASRLDGIVCTTCMTTNQ